MAQELIRHNVLSLDFWQDTVTYAGSFASCRPARLAVRYGISPLKRLRSWTRRA